MRRKTFEVLFEPSTGMTEVAEQACLWRSASYFCMSTGFFWGVVINTYFSQQPLAVRGALILSVMLISAAILLLYGFIVHGIVETYGQTGNPVSFLCLLGYTALPFLILTPAALLASRYGMTGLPFLGLCFLAGVLWLLFLLVRSIQVVYIIDLPRAVGAVVLSLVLLYTVFGLPLQIAWTLIERYWNFN